MSVNGLDRQNSWFRHRISDAAWWAPRIQRLGRRRASRIHYQSAGTILDNCRSEPIRPFDRSPGEEVTVAGDAGSPPAPTLAGIADHERLLEVFRQLRRTGGESPGPDGYGYPDLGRSEAAEVCRCVARQLRDREYRPGPSRVVKIRKPNGRYRELRIGSILRRIVAAAVVEIITPTFEPMFLPASMGFRPGQSCWTLLATLARTIEATGYTEIAQDDIRDAFPSVPVADAMADYRRHLDDEGLLWLIETLLHGERNEQHPIGIEQGCPLSPLTMNLRLHKALDLPQHAAGLGFPLGLRYVDNLLYLCPSVPDGHQWLHWTGETLRTAGFTLKGEAGPPVNLRRQGARVDLLGYQTHLANGQLRLGIGKGGYASLEQTLEKAHTANSPARAAQAAVRGWLTAAGPSIESEEGCSTVTRVRRIAARYGYRELGTGAQLEACLQMGYERWREIRLRA